MNEPIIILGTPRSGTSLVAGLFHIHGVFVGKCREADANNPKGYFENTELAVLRYVDLLQPPAVNKLLRRQGYAGGPWLVKHTPRYHRHWRDFSPKFVKVRRDIEQTLRSRIDSGHFQETALQAKKTILRDIHTMERHTKGPTVWSDQVVKGDYASLEAAMSDCGITMDKGLVDAFVDRSLWHGAAE